MKFSDLKTEAKAQLNPHYGFFLLLLLPTYILQILVATIYYQQYTGFMSNFISSIKLDNMLAANSSLNQFNFSTNGLQIISLLTSALLLSALFVMIKVMRNQETDFTDGFKKAFNIFTKGDYFFGAFMVGLLKRIYLFLWVLLASAISIGAFGTAFWIGDKIGFMVLFMIIAALIAIAAFVFYYTKSLAYSQAQFIFRDAIDSDNPIGYNKAITQSRQLMDGHKGEFFLLKLSFILWYILNAITLGIAGFFYVTPYTNLTFANYYTKLTAAK